MSGFGSIVGFMFSFFIIMGLIISGFVFFQHNIASQLEVSKSNSDKLLLEQKNGFEILNSFYNSGRVVFNLKDLDLDFIKVKDKNNNFCFSSFLNNNYISNSLFYFSIDNKSLLNNYQVFTLNEIGKFYIKKDLNLNVNNNFELISCGGFKKSYKLNKDKLNWFSNDFGKRLRINISNAYSNDLAEYQIELNLNSSIIDDNLFKKGEYSFVVPLSNFEVLNLPFDKYSQDVKDFSKYNNLVTLGDTNLVASNDPSNSKGVILDGLNFDGIDDYVLINPGSSLNLTKEITISTWIKWNGFGNSLQNIFTNGGWSNALRIVNDGGVNQNKLLFQLNIDGSVRYLYSNFLIDNSSWYHVTATYDGTNMKLYVNGVLDSILNAPGEIIPFSGNSNYIGTEGINYFFNGSLDEFKLYEVALSENEIRNVYFDNFIFRNLNFYTSIFEPNLNKYKFFVKIPMLRSRENLTIDLYYNLLNSSNSFNYNIYDNIEKTFSYTKERLVGYVVSDMISSNSGISIISLFDNNSIKVGSNLYNLNKMQTQTIGTAFLNQNDSVYLRFLAQVEGNGNADDIIVPISFASNEFYFMGFRTSGNNDIFCMLSPFGNSWVEVRDSGILIWNGSVDNSGLCQTFDIPTNNNLAINSTIPILVSYRGGTSRDAFVFYPATDEDLYGIPSNSGLLGVGPNGGSINVFRTDGTFSTYSVGSYGTLSFSSGGGNQGSVSGHWINIQKGVKAGAIQQADSDGSESTIFVEEKDFGTLFGSSLGTEYITLISKYSDANCSVYDSGLSLVGNIVNGVGANGIYKYDFGTGSSSDYVNEPWILTCDKPVFGYYEETINGDETNLFGFVQMRQYVYPEPVIGFE
jgi:hypothetical protein